MRDREYRRVQRERHIKRKEQILRKLRLDNPPHKYDDKDLFGAISFPHSSWDEGDWIPYWYEKKRGYLAKGKIHSSDRTRKTKNKGKHRHKPGNYSPSINYKHSDLQKIAQMNWDEKNWNVEELYFISYIYNLALRRHIFDMVPEEEFWDMIDTLY